MKVTLTEAQLRSVVKNIITKVLNESSAKLAMSAYDKAKDMGRYHQADKFFSAAIDRFKEEYPSSNLNADDDSILITVKSNYGADDEKFKLYKQGDFLTFSGCNYGEPSSTHVCLSPRDARLIAKWWKNWGNNKHPEYGDWHTWLA